MIFLIVSDTEESCNRVLVTREATSSLNQAFPRTGIPQDVKLWESNDLNSDPYILGGHLNARKWTLFPPVLRFLRAWDLERCNFS